MGKKFLRSETVRLLRLGKKRRKLQKWRKPRGRHSKIRKKRFGYPLSPSIGYKKPRSSSGLIRGKAHLLVRNIGELERAGKNLRIVLSRRLGAKKRLELLKKAAEMGLEVVTAGVGA